MVEANGLRFHVRDEGSGPAVILLHGFPDTGDLWRNQAPALVGAGFRVIAPDMRGRGRSDKPPAVADYGLRNMVGDVTGILDALGVEKAHVVGHDWGAAVAWLVGSLAPQRVERLVAMSVGFPGAAGPPDLEALQKMWYRILITTEATAGELFQAEDWYLLRTFLKGAADVEAYIATLSEPGALAAGLNWYRANLPIQSILGSRPVPLPPVAAPTLGMWSTGDEYLTEAAMVRSADHVAGPWKYERIEDATHWIPLDQPDRVNALLLEFLR